MMKRILLTGGRGFFASRFAQAHAGTYDILSLRRDEMNVTDEADVMEKTRQFQPDYVIHTAANAVTAFCDKNPAAARRINVDGAVYVARAARAVGAKLLFISTEQLFNGNQNAGPFREEDASAPDTVYGQNKKEAEGLLRQILDELWIVRFTWLFGMPQRGCGMSGNILWNTVQSILKNERIVAPVHEYRGMTYVHEMTEQIVKLFDAPYGTYHLGSENSRSRYDIVREIFCGLGLEARIPELLVADKEKYAAKPRDVRLNADKAKRFGLVFSDTSTALQKCIGEYGLRIG